MAANSGDTQLITSSSNASSGPPPRRAAGYQTFNLQNDRVRCIDKYVHVWIPDTNTDTRVKPVPPNPMVPFTNPFDLQEQTHRMQEPSIVHRPLPPPSGMRIHSESGARKTIITRLKDELVSSASTRLHDEQVKVSDSPTKANTAEQNMVDVQTDDKDKKTDNSPMHDSTKIPTLLKYYGLIRNYGFTNFLDSMMRRKSSYTGLDRNILDQIKQNEDTTEPITNNYTQDNKPQSSLEDLSKYNIKQRLDNKTPEGHSHLVQDRSMTSNQSNAQKQYQITNPLLSSSDQMNARTSNRDLARSEQVDSAFDLSILREFQTPSSASSDKPADDNKSHVWRSPPPLKERNVNAFNTISRDSNELLSEAQPQYVRDSVSTRMNGNDQPLEQQKAPILTKKQRTARLRGNRAGLDDEELPTWWPGSTVTPYTTSQQKQIAVTWTNDSEKKAFTSHRFVNIRNNADGATVAGHNWPTVAKGDHDHQVDPPHPENGPIYVKPVVRIYNYERIRYALRRYVTHLKSAMFKAKQGHDQSLKEELIPSPARSLPSPGEGSLPTTWRTNFLPDDPSDPTERLKNPKKITAMTQDGFAYFVYTRRLLQELKGKTSKQKYKLETNRKFNDNDNE